MKSKLFNTLAAATTLTGIVFTAGTASAASVSYTASTGDFDFTNFNKTLSIQQFDDSLGTLESVVLEVTGAIERNAEFESRDNAPSTITATTTGDLNLSQNNTSLLTLNFENSESFEASAFDGVIDFGGTSGAKLDEILQDQSDTRTLTTGLDAFIGTGNVDFLLSAIGESEVTGAGNIISSISTLAKGSLEVTYNFDSPDSTSVPEPSTFLGFGLIAGFGVLSQRKKNRFQVSK